MYGVLHEYPDEKCRVILQNTAAALGKDSVILIDDLVLPNSRVQYQATQVDLLMMCAHAGIERTKAQWEALLDSVGLVISERYEYYPGGYESVSVAIPK